ncbi:MAG: hypothetical protein HPY54_15380 [Chthonomonadetes bacterium]|nr:hypothetical protein [Chthonomonadetes bacterium]
MRTTMILAIVLAAAISMSQQEVIRIPGEVRFASAETQRTTYYDHQLTLSNQLPDGVRLPEWARQGCRYGRIKLGRPLQQWHFVISPETLRAVVDINRNNDLTDDPVLFSASQYSWAQTYAPIRLAVSLNGALCSRYFSIHYTDGRAFLLSEDLRRFSGTVDGKPFQMMVVDGNADGAFDTPSQSRWKGDRCLISADGAEMPAQEAPVPRLYQVGDRYYRLRIAPDGSVCELHPTDIQIATVQVSPANVKLTLIGKKVGFWEAETTSGTLQLPADDYNVQEYTVTTIDSLRRTWQLQVAGSEGLKIKADGSTEATLRLPESLVATLAYGSRVRKEALDIALVLFPAGQHFQRVVGINVNGDLPPPPTLRIVDRNGRTVRVEKFHYG